jgi:hypothetical protein
MYSCNTYHQRLKFSPKEVKERNKLPVAFIDKYQKSFKIIDNSNSSTNNHISTD